MLTVGGLGVTIDIEKEPWAKKMSRLLVTAARAVRRAAEQGQSVVAERASRRIVAVYEALVLRGQSRLAKLPLGVLQLQSEAVL